MKRQLILIATIIGGCARAPHPLQTYNSYSKLSRANHVYVTCAPPTGMQAATLDHRLIDKFVRACAGGIYKDPNNLGSVYHETKIIFYGESGTIATIHFGPEDLPKFKPEFTEALREISLLGEPEEVILTKIRNPEAVDFIKKRSNEYNLERTSILRKIR